MSSKTILKEERQFIKHNPMNFWPVLCRLLVLGVPSLPSKRQNLAYQLRCKGRWCWLENCSGRWEMNQPEMSKRIPGFGEGCLGLHKGHPQQARTGKQLIFPQQLTVTLSEGQRKPMQDRKGIQECTVIRKGHRRDRLWN